MHKQEVYASSKSVGEWLHEGTSGNALECIERNNVVISVLESRREELKEDGKLRLELAVGKEKQN